MQQLLSKNNHNSKCHCGAVEVMVTLPVTTRDIGEQLSSQHAREKEQNWQMLLKIISCVRFLTRQGLSLLGDGDEKKNNF